MNYSGIVVGGSARAHTLGFPTANIPLSDPAVAGIYAAKVLVEGKHYGAVAFADPTRNVLEAHLFEFSGDLYGKTITISLIEKIRDTKAFTNDTELKEEMQRDAQAARKHLGL